jgi:hypothetical protein
MCSGQATTHSRQRVHAAVNAGSASAQGGRSGVFLRLKSPRRNWRRVMSVIR